MEVSYILDKIRNEEIIINKIVIATHGTLAEGMKNTLELISGPQDTIKVMSFYNGNESLDQEVTKVFEELGDDSLVVCTDVQFGSVNQRFVMESLKYPDKEVYIVSGINLPFMLEIVTTQSKITKEALNDMIEKATQQLTLVRTEALFNNSDQDDIFY